MPSLRVICAVYKKERFHQVALFHKNMQFFPCNCWNNPARWQLKLRLKPYLFCNVMKTPLGGSLTQVIEKLCCNCMEIPPGGMLVCHLVERLCNCRTKIPGPPPLPPRPQHRFSTLSEGKVPTKSFVNRKESIPAFWKFELGHFTLTKDRYSYGFFL